MEEKIAKYLRDCEAVARTARLFLSRDKIATIGQLRKRAQLTAPVLHDERVEEGGHWTGQHYNELPCGCKNFTTVLTDGSLGWGEWSEYCSFHSYDEDGNLI